MRMSEVRSTGAPSPIGPYSQAVVGNGVLYASGQLPLDPASGDMPDDIAGQTRQCLENLRAVLEAGAADMSSVTSVTVLLDSLADFDVMNAVYSQYFAAPYPARVAYEVSALPKRALVEIAAIAMVTSPAEIPVDRTENTDGE